MNPNNGQFEKGDTPWNLGKTGYMGSNKTSFGKGNKPKNTLPLGSKRIDSYGHEEQKIGMPGAWKQTRHIVWETKNPPVEKGLILRFKDGDTTNIVIDNLEAVTRAENLVLNRMGYNSTPEKFKKSVKLLAQISVKKSELKRS